MTYQIRAFPQRNRLGLLCCVAIAAVVVATLWPFDFRAANKVSWLSDAAGLRFNGQGIVLSSAPLNPAVASSRDSCSLEVWMRPASIKSVGIVLALYVENTRSEFVLVQKMNRLVISRASSNGLDDIESRGLDEDHTFEAGALVLVTITSGPNGMTVYLDSGRSQYFPGFMIMPGYISGQIVLGTSTLFFSPYSGEIRGLAIYPNELDPTEVQSDFRTWTSGRTLDPAALPGALALYGFAEGTGSQIRSAVESAPVLQIPQYFVLPHKPFLESPSDEFIPKWSYVHSVAENILGFVPLGFILCAYFACARSPRRAILYAILAGGTLSFVVEILQFYIPSRGSGLTDVITNTTGAALGALLIVYMRTNHREDPRRKPAPG